MANMFRFKVLCSALLFGLAGLSAVRATEINTEWVDARWRDHILWRAEQLSTNQNSVYAESFCRDALKLDPGNARSLFLLTRIYAMKGETSLLAMSSLLGLDLYPAESFWKHTLEKANERIDTRPLAPSEEELAVKTNKFTVYLKEAVRTREVDRNLLISEVALRSLLIDYPLNLNLLEELSLNYRLSREWTMCAMVNRLGMEHYPENMGFFYNYLESLRLMGKLEPGWERINTALAGGSDAQPLLEFTFQYAVANGSTAALGELLAPAIKKHPDTDFWLAIGRSLIGRKQLAAAVPALELAHRQDPARYEPVYDLAVVHSVMEQYPECLRWLGLLRQRVDTYQFNSMVKEGPFSTNLIQRIEGHETNTP